ncbi:uncharacterized protein [Palaemon carinicauda]|uniref:uncharacterized protein n=1 Tax=Palaemon carinicauda TaxID=392227 RepID=UPI0035B6897E
MTPEFGSWTHDWAGLLRTPQPTTHGEAPRKGAWNIRILQDVTNTNRPERRTALVCKDLARFNVDVTALSETRLPEEGNIREAGTRYAILWKGKALEEPRIHGVGFAICSQLVQQHNLALQAISEHLMTVRIPITRDRHLTLISVYAQTMTSTDDDKAAFYTHLDRTIQAAPTNDKLVVLGDFNALVGKDHRLNAPDSVPPQRFDCSKLRNPQVAQNYKEACERHLADPADPVGQATVEHHWTTLRNDKARAAEETLGYTTKNWQDWFDENDATISLLIETKRQALLTLENQPTAANKCAHRVAEADCQRGIHEAQNTWWQRKAAEIQSFADQHTPDDLLRITPQHPVRHWMALQPSIQDFNKPLQCMKPGKAAGPDNIPLELLTHGGPGLRNQVVLPESQCGFRPSRGTIDLTFCARQLQEKNLEQQLPIMFIFWGLKKAFDKIPQPTM